MSQGWAAKCGNCDNLSTMSQWLSPAIEKLQVGVMQCPVCKVRIRRRGVGAVEIDGYIIPERVVVDIELPPYVSLIDRMEYDTPFRKKRQKRKS
jgi:hypothetical protein